MFCSQPKLYDYSSMVFIAIQGVVPQSEFPINHVASSSWGFSMCDQDYVLLV